MNINYKVSGLGSGFLAQSRNRGNKRGFGQVQGSLALKEQQNAPAVSFESLLKKEFNATAVSSSARLLSKDRKKRAASINEQAAIQLLEGYWA